MNISAPLAITRIEALEARVNALENLIMRVGLLEASVQDIKWGIKHNQEASLQVEKRHQ